MSGMSGWFNTFAPRVSEALEDVYRQRLMKETRGVRALLFGFIAVSFGLAPVYGPFLFEVHPDTATPLRAVNLAVVLPCALLGLYGALGRRLRVEVADLLMLAGGGGIAAGMLADYHLGRLADFEFPFSWTCFLLSALILAARVPFRRGCILVLLTVVVAVGLEWGLQGFTHKANFNVATILLFVSITLYAGSTLERTTLAALESLQQLKAMAQTDELTSLPNRRAAMEHAAELFRRSARKKRRVAIAIVDIDYFKKVNDSYGHAEGDRVLRWVGLALADARVETDDMAARIGGEEFLMLWSQHTERQVVIDRADELRRAISALSETGATGSEAPLPPITVTIGIHEGVPDSTSSYNQYLARADEALYEGKSAGRNRVVASAAFTPRIVTREDGATPES